MQSFDNLPHWAGQLVRAFLESGTLPDDAAMQAIPEASVSEARAQLVQQFEELKALDDSEHDLEKGLGKLKLQLPRGEVEAHLAGDTSDGWLFCSVECPDGNDSLIAMVFTREGARAITASRHQGPVSFNALSLAADGTGQAAGRGQPVDPWQALQALAAV